jgi:hypothetical protein
MRRSWSRRTSGCQGSDSGWRPSGWWWRRLSPGRIWAGAQPSCNSRAGSRGRAPAAPRREGWSRKGRGPRVRRSRRSGRPARCRGTGRPAIAGRIPSRSCRARSSSSGPQALGVARSGRWPWRRASGTAARSSSGGGRGLVDGAGGGQASPPPASCEHCERLRMGGFAEGFARYALAIKHLRQAAPDCELCEAFSEQRGEGLPLASHSGFVS